MAINAGVLAVKHAPASWRCVAGKIISHGCRRRWQRDAAPAQRVKGGGVSRRRARGGEMALGAANAISPNYIPTPLVMRILEQWYPKASAEEHHRKWRQVVVHGYDDDRVVNVHQSAGSQAERVSAPVPSWARFRVRGTCSSCTGGRSLRPALPPPWRDSGEGPPTTRGRLFLLPCYIFSLLWLAEIPEKMLSPSTFFVTR
ncbi:hypothetical protein ZWY2020_012392 [Hordeum vulgare]|nr:hypothetical protein ZWY2020_012392 [Hordeum vulgare]